MSFKEKNILVTLLNFTLILAYYLFQIFQMSQNDSFTEENVFRVWAVIIVFATLVTVVAILLTHLVPAIIQARKLGKDKPEFSDLEDERDKLIDLKGTKLTYTVSSLGAFVSMLTYVFGQAPLVMFSLLIFFGLLAQILGDISRLLRYREGY